MALVTIPGGGLWIPAPPAFSVSAPAFGSNLLDAAAEKFAMIFRVEKTGTLDQFEFRLGVVTQAPANGLKCSFQDRDPATGDPDGVVDQSRVVTAGLTANTWVTPGLITSDGTDAGVKRAVTRGDILACVIEFESFSAGDSLNILDLAGPNSNVGQPTFGAFPFTDLYTAAWAKQVGAYPCLALKYNDGTFGYVNATAYPLKALNTTTFNSSSTPDERGLIFQLPGSVRVGGAWVRVDLDGDADIVLYDSDGTTALETVSLDKDIRVGTVGGNHEALFPTDRQLTKGTDYRLVVKPTSVTNLSTYDFDVNAAAMLAAAGGGQNWRYTQRTDAGAWTETATKRPWMGLRVVAVDDGLGGRGSIRHVYGPAYDRRRR